jgi:hypothetical protein
VRGRERGEGRWAGGCGWAGKVGWAAGRRKKGSGPDGEGVWGFWVCFFSFFKSLLNNFSKPFLNQTLLHLFHNLFHNFLKTFKAVQQQTHAYQNDAQKLG